MTAKETDKIFDIITSNSCREMTKIRFNQAINEILNQHTNSKLNTIIKLMNKKKKSYAHNNFIWYGGLDDAIAIIKKELTKKS